MIEHANWEAECARLQNAYDGACNAYSIEYANWEEKCAAVRSDDGTKLGSELLKGLRGRLRIQLDKVNREISARRDEIAKIVEKSNIVAAKKTESKRLPRQLPDKMKGSDIQSLRFTSLGFNAYWQELLGNVPERFSSMVYGDAKAGKSYFAYEFAEYLTAFGDVVYFAAEEGIEDTTQRKINATNALNVYFHEPKDIDDIRKYLRSCNTMKFAFIDSVTKMDMSADAFSKLMREYKDVCFIVLLQVTKSGTFAGEQAWKHIVDAVIHVERNGESSTISCTGRFGSGKREVQYA